MNDRKGLLLTGIVLAILLSTACSKSASNSITALKKIHAAVQSGVKYDLYSQLVIDAQAAVNEDSSKLPDGELKKELTSALDAYNDAKWAWEISRRAPASNGPDSFILAAGLQDVKDLSYDRKAQTKARELFQKYDLISGKESDNELILISTDDLLQAIWNSAGKHVNRASELNG